MKNLSSPLLVFVLSVVINEVAWMGSEVSYNDEWIELKNNTQEEIDLDGWVLKADDGTPEIGLEGLISANGFYLLERTDDETVAGIPADLIYKGALSNGGENLKLYDNSGNLIDEVISQDGWPAGDNGAKFTMERFDSGWQNSAEPGGTPKAENQGDKLLEQPQPEDMEGDKLQEYPTGIIFQKIMPSPEGPDAENEWIELFNQNGFEVELSGWQIRDVVGRTTSYTLNTKIKELSSLILSRPETKITLNNNGDGLELINPNGEIVDSVSFEKAPLGQSYIRTDSGWAWARSLAPSKSQEETEGAKLIEQARPEKNKGAKLLKIGQEKKKRSLAPWFIALVLALFSGAVIVYLNNRLSGGSHLERGRPSQF